MKTWLVWLVAGGVALLGGILGLLNPVAAQVTSTTIAGCALVLMGLLQGRAALKSTALHESAGSFIFAAAGLFLGLSLIFGPIGEGRLLGLTLAGLLIISGAAKLWIGRRAKSDPVVWLVVGAGGGVGGSGASRRSWRRTATGCAPVSGIAGRWCGAHRDGAAA